jgi:hypothetical protein
LCIAGFLGRAEFGRQREGGGVLAPPFAHGQRQVRVDQVEIDPGAARLGDDLFR